MAVQTRALTKNEGRVGWHHSLTPLLNTGGWYMGTDKKEESNALQTGMRNTWEYAPSVSRSCPCLFLVTSLGLQSFSKGLDLTGKNITFKSNSFQHWVNSNCLTPPSNLCSVAKSCPSLCNPVGCSPTGSSICGILQARILEWVVLPSSKRSSQHRDQTCISCFGSWILYHGSPLRRPVLLRFLKTALSLIGTLVFFHLFSNVLTISMLNISSSPPAWSLWRRMLRLYLIDFSEHLIKIWHLIKIYSTQKADINRKTWLIVPLPPPRPRFTLIIFNSLHLP